MLHILGMGCAHPDEVISSQFIEDLDVGTSVEWIESKIGIKTRVTSLKQDYIQSTLNQDPTKAQEVASIDVAGLGVEAAKRALNNCQLKLSEIGLIISNTCNPGDTAPGLAARVAARLADDLGEEYTGQAYDVTSACPAFALHIDYLNSIQEEQLPKYVLCFDSSVVTQSVNYSDRSDGAIWGDGSAAWIVSPQVSRGVKVLDTLFDADPTRCSAVVIDRYGHFRQDGRAVRDFSVRHTVRLIKRIETNFPVDWSRDVFIGHQANRTMLEQITNNRKIPPTNHWHNVAEFGNQGGAGAPAVLAQNWHRLQPGQLVVVAVVGAGLSWGSMVLEVL